MDGRFSGRLVLDVLMVVTTFAVFSYPLTGNFLHEALGVCLLALAILHNVANRRWYPGRWRSTTGRNRTRTIGNWLLLLSFAGTVVSGLLRSRSRLPYLRMGDPLLVRQVHVTSACWLLLLAGIHWGLHWDSSFLKVTKRLRFDGTALAGKVLRAAGVGIVLAYGLHALIYHDVGAKLAARSSYDFVGQTGSPWTTTLDFSALLLSTAVITHAVSCLAKRLTKNAPD